MVVFRSTGIDKSMKTTSSNRDLKGSINWHAKAKKTLCIQISTLEAGKFKQKAYHFSGMRCVIAHPGVLGMM